VLIVIDNGSKFFWAIHLGHDPPEAKHSPGSHEGNRSPVFTLTKRFTKQLLKKAASNSPTCAMPAATNSEFPTINNKPTFSTTPLATKTSDLPTPSLGWTTVRSACNSSGLPQTNCQYNADTALKAPATNSNE
jgi:hypothetical protein